ncbi:MAG: hypothetical protein NUV51_03690 [Sulfuricaulis sp.]|nr:hypothetical protein [Sulfuricaulis sp.]
MTTKITLTYCGMEGQGATVKLAKQDAARKIEAVLDGGYTPFIIRHFDLIGVIFREPSGWSYKIIYPDTKSGPAYGSCSSFGDSEAQCRSHCAHHIAQNAGSYSGLQSHLTDSDMRELDRYFAWQERFRKARAQGYDESQSRQMADQNTTCV